MKLSELKETIRQVIEARGPSRGFNKLASAYQKEALKHQSMVKDQKRLAAAFVAEKEPKKKEKAKKAIIDHHHKVKDQEKKMKKAEQEMLNGLDKEKIDLDERNVPRRKISLMWNQRSVDVFLGLPFNISSYALLLRLIAEEVNMVPNQLIGNLGDTHLYLNHIEQAKEQIKRTPYCLPEID